jgi:hypothetical protein
LNFEADECVVHTDEDDDYENQGDEKDPADHEDLGQKRSSVRTIRVDDRRVKRSGARE